jgi:poly-gamma-glutamate capsule biosynthesis protein CapA/YwtB (metallophosphatase superfamily)
MAAGQDCILSFFAATSCLGGASIRSCRIRATPTLYEAYVTSALGYVRLAERAHGPIPRKCAYDYVWGDALADLEAARPHARIINLETSITAGTSPLPKGINYKMHPENVPCLKAALVDCCVLANNHVLDWGREGLLETLAVLQRENILMAGAGLDQAEAEKPAAIGLPEGRRVLIFGLGAVTSGIPQDWAAGKSEAGVSLLPDLSLASASKLAERILATRGPGDLVVVSIHWGSNWGHDVPEEQRAFAHALVDAGACDVLHGHSSHHPRALEVYREG